ncbi:hypothetical protein SeMB42_g06713 [Synchytrium endobioticum]|uniref:Anaphase-promoting complex subunit 4 WD40 domain-containing protein n=1 Tax=Synchytrium endobioticum TaxID=286115 RepID=A0A507CA96_9FUNG|nr:hypothetical protein SeMB42_g06713 [Synchytrium endobioticum]TPX39296.1 hypothetical protein SeLEV6574_g07317 [Synchytrium endobioticum]
MRSSTADAHAAAGAGADTGTALQPPQPQPQRFRGHHAPITCVATPSPNTPSQLASASEDATVRIWDMETRRGLRGIRCFDGIEVTSVVYASPDVVYASSTQAVYCIDLRSHSSPFITSPSYAFGAIGHISPDINHICVNEKSRYLAIADDSCIPTILDLRTRKSVTRFRASHDNYCTSISFRPNKPWHVCSGGLDCTLITWDFSNGTVLDVIDMNSSNNPTQSVNPPYVNAIAFASGASNCALALGDGTICVLPSLTANKKKKTESNTLSMTRVDAHAWAVTALHYVSPSILVSASIDKTVRIWDSLCTVKTHTIQTNIKINTVTSHVIRSDDRTKALLFIGGAATAATSKQCDIVMHQIFI